MDLTAGAIGSVLFVVSRYSIMTSWHFVSYKLEAKDHTNLRDSTLESLHCFVCKRGCKPTSSQRKAKKDGAEMHTRGAVLTGCEYQLSVRVGEGWWLDWLNGASLSWESLAFIKFGYRQAIRLSAYCIFTRCHVKAPGGYPSFECYFLFHAIPWWLCLRNFWRTSSSSRINEGMLPRKTFPCANFSNPLSWPGLTMTDKCKID